MRRRLSSVNFTLEATVALGVATAMAAALGAGAFAADRADPAARAPDEDHSGAVHYHRPHDPTARPPPSDSGGPSDLRGAASTEKPGKSAAVTYGGGPILPNVAVRIVPAGPAWSRAKFVADKFTGLDAFFEGYANSRYAATADEYTGNNGTVGSGLAYQGRAAPVSTSVDGRQMTQVLAAACNEVASGHFQMRTDGTQLVIVYSDMGRPAASNFCGYHTAASCLNQPVEIAFLWNLDGDGGCSPQDSSTGHSSGLAALTNVTAHELAETRTDPDISAWIDSAGYEIGDKCAWTFAHGSVPFTNGTKWKLQTEWSNAAYAAGTGHTNGSGQPGCIDGSN
jgi:hypothetical protein